MRGLGRRQRGAGVGIRAWRSSRLFFFAGLILFRLDSGDHGGSMSNSKPVYRQFLFLVLAACVSATASAQTRPKRTDPGAAPNGILWVGNSFFYYNNSMHNHVSNLVRAADPT